MTTDRNPIYIQLINSYLSQLTEDDLYKLHDIVRNTVTSRLEPSAKDSVDEEPPHRPA